MTELTQGIFSTAKGIYKNNKGSILRTIIYTIGHFAIAIVVLGPKDFPIMLKKAGSWIGTAKRYVSNIQNEVSNIDIDDETNKEFVGMYVNNRTIDYGKDGRDAIRLFLKEGQKIGMVDENLVVDEIKFIGSGE